MNKIYCIILFQDSMRAICLDRKYYFISEDKGEWGNVRLGDIVENDHNFFAGKNIPDWASEAEANGERHIALWTNYYEKEK